MLRRLAYGNFKQMILEVTLDPQMLLYLNGAANNRFAPDENYSRELQELFTIGKGPDAGYTETDVQEAARVLTGHSVDWEQGATYLFRDYWHDTGDKQFSAFYNHTKIAGRSGPAGATEVDDLIDMIFEANEVAAFVVRKLYRFYVYSHIDAQTEAQVIQPLAQVFRDNDYEIKPVLRALFRSAHFYDPENMGAMIKSPLDFMIGFWRTFDVNMPAGATVTNEREIRTSMLWNMSSLGLELMDPPNVAGYPAYYQVPQFDKHWITTNSITNRAVITDSFIYWGFWSQNLLTNVDLLAHIATLPNPGDPDRLIDDLVAMHLGYPLSDKVKQHLRSILLSGQLDPSYWTNAWFEYWDDPQDEMKINTVEIRAKVMFQTLLQRAEYHLA